MPKVPNTTNKAIAAWVRSQIRLMRRCPSWVRSCWKVVVGGNALGSMTGPFGTSIGSPLCKIVSLALMAWVCRSIPHFRDTLPVSGYGCTPTVYGRLRLGQQRIQSLDIGAQLVKIRHSCPYGKGT